jgi:radical SAM protein with 4Fe4S-binding SPASM domain
MTELNELKRLNVEVTNICNYLCTGCPTLSLKRERGYMDSSLFFKIFEEAGNNLEKVFLWNYGESTLHPNFSQLLRGIGNFTTKKILSTNGSRLLEFEDPSLFRNLDELIISLNGLDAPTYNLHQKGGDFLKVMQGIRKVAPFIKDAKTNYALQVVVHKGNLEQLSFAEDFARKEGFDELVFKSFNVMDKQQKTFDEFVPFGTSYSRYSEKNPSTHPTKSGKGRGCINSMVINWNGDVNACCWDYTGKTVLGNVLNQGVYGVWNSEKAKEFRQSILSKQFSDFCVECAINPVITKIKLSEKN